MLFQNPSQCFESLIVRVALYTQQRQPYSPGGGLWERAISKRGFL